MPDTQDLLHRWNRHSFTLTSAAQLRETWHNILNRPEEDALPQNAGMQCFNVRFELFDWKWTTEIVSCSLQALSFLYRFTDRSPFLHEHKGYTQCRLQLPRLRDCCRKSQNFCRWACRRHMSMASGGSFGGPGRLTLLTLGTGKKIATVASLQKEDVDSAVDAAVNAFEGSGWAKMPVNERSAILHRIADAVEQRKAVFAQIESIDCGKIYSQAEGDVENFIDTFRYFADLAQTVNYRNVIAVRNHEAWVARHPWGPCGFIIPWNFPFLLAGWGLGPALAAGNTCVLKPAEDTPLSALYLCRMIQQLDLLPAGVLNVVTDWVRPPDPLSRATQSFAA